VVQNSMLREGTTPKATPGPNLADWVFYALILLMGAIQFICYPHASDFVNDPGYPDLARAILEQHKYQFDFLPMTTLPPGLPLLLALVGKFWGLSPAVQFRVIALSTTLGLIVAYYLLRRVEGRGLALGVCLLFGSSPVLFGFCTALIFPEMPYFLASMVALLLAVKIDRTERAKVPIAWMLLLGLVLIMAVLIRSVGIALLAGLGAWIVVSLFVAPEMGRRRLKRFLLPLVLGLIAQFGWSVWAGGHQVLEWQLLGYPQSYMSQVIVKNGQHPELGVAKLGDIPSRVGRNIVTRTAGFDQILTRHYIGPFWSSPAIFGMLILVVLGLADSFRKGGELHDWYFLWYEAIFLVWPWDYRDRFVFPVVPLACLYLWRGLRVFQYHSIRRPKAVGVGLIVSGSILCVTSVAFAYRVLAFTVETGHTRGDHLQPLAAAFFWAVLAAMGFFMLKFPSLGGSADKSTPPWYGRIGGLEKFFSLRLATALGIALLVGVGMKAQIGEARHNLNMDARQEASYGEIQAADWIRTHEPPDRVVMARDQDMFFHYTGGRRVVWFPPISDPNVLMEGIRRHHVGVIVVVNPPLKYWLPTEDVCFQLLAQAYGSAFQLVHRDPKFQVYEVALPTDRKPNASQ